MCRSDVWFSSRSWGRGLVCANRAGIAARCDSKGADKVTVKVALIGKSRILRNIGKTRTALDHGACKINAPLDQIGV